MVGEQNIFPEHCEKLNQIPSKELELASSLQPSAHILLPTELQDTKRENETELKRKMKYENESLSTSTKAWIPAAKSECDLLSSTIDDQRTANANDSRFQAHADMTWNTSLDTRQRSFPQDFHEHSHLCLAISLQSRVLSTAKESEHVNVTPELR